MRAGLDRAFAVVFNLAAPENGLAFFVGGLQFEPNIEGVYRPTREKVTYLARANDHVHANIIAAAHGGVGAIDGSGNRADFAGWAPRQRGLRFLSDCEGRGEFLLAHFIANRSA